MIMIEIAILLGGSVSTRTANMLEFRIFLSSGHIHEIQSCLILNHLLDPPGSMRLNEY